MNRTTLVILASSIAAIAAAAEADPAEKQLQVYPKNIARHHIGANLFLFNATSQAYAPTEAAAAWLDDDITSGWAPVAGKQYYMLALPEPEVVNNLALSTQGAKGKVTIYAGDEPSAPGASSWQPVARDVSLESIDGKKLAKPFNRLAKYILLETEITEAAPIHSLYFYGERPATSYQLVKREQPIDTKAIFGPYTNNLAAISSSGLYSGGRVAFSTEPGNYTAWQKAIDDNPETGVGLITSGDQAGMVLKLNDSQPVTRLSILAGNTSKGKLEVFVVPALPDAQVAAAPAPAEGVQPVASKAKSSVVSQPVALTGLTPSATFTFDGTNVRQSQDLTGAQGTALLFRWTPEFSGEAFVLRELNAFGNFSLSDYSLALSPEAVAELAKDRSKDGKAFVSKEGKALEPVGELFPQETPYLPPSLGFPPPIPPTFVVTSP